MDCMRCNLRALVCSLSRGVIYVQILCKLQKVLFNDMLTNSTGNVELFAVNEGLSGTKGLSAI